VNPGVAEQPQQFGAGANRWASSADRAEGDAKRPEVGVLGDLKRGVRSD